MGKLCTAMLAFVLVALSAVANDGDNGKKAPRTMNYYPDNGEIVCVNGNNRYTRALYGSHTRMRLETSDRPVFATYDRDKSINIAFAIETGGQKIALDSTTYCEARYQGGRRTYTLADDSWKGARLHITTMATFGEEGAIWEFHTEGFENPPMLYAVTRKLAKTKMTRDGDYGLEPRSSFEGVGDPLQTVCWLAKGDTYLLLTPDRELRTDSDGAQRMAQEEQTRQQLLSRLQIDTPDPYINTLGASLAAAADGLWDGSTWLHGCCPRMGRTCHVALRRLQPEHGEKRHTHLLAPHTRQCAQHGSCRQEMGDTDVQQRIYLPTPGRHHKDEPL